MAAAKKLSNSQIKFLRGIAHHINANIIIGGNGVTDSLMAELENTLARHELLKIKIAIGERDDRKKIVEYILEQTRATLIQSIGKTCTIFRQKEKDSEFELPRK
jgi:RNA-binding protein